MSHLTAMLERVRFPFLRLRRVGLLLSTLLLAVTALWLLFYALSPADASSAPLYPESLGVAQARPAFSAQVLTSGVASAQAPMSSDDPLILGWASAEVNSSKSVAWGDYDGDGDLDLAVGNSLDLPNRLYRNDHGKLIANAVYTFAQDTYYGVVAWAD